MEKYPGVNEFIHEFGLENIDSLSPIDRINVAFTAGRLYEAKKDRERLVNEVEG